MKTTSFLITGLATIFLLITSTGVSAFTDRPETYTARSPSIILQELIRGNREFVLQHDRGYFEASQTKQTPSLTVVSCADSRVHTDLFGIDPNNKIFSIRNIGNQIQNSEGSVDYGVRHLSTPVLLIMGHSDCGAVKTAMDDLRHEAAGLKSELIPITTAMKDDDGSGKYSSRLARNTERNVDYQVAYARKLYSDRISSGELVIIGAVYDISNHYGKGRGALILTNVDGETDPEKFMRHSTMRFLTRSEITARIGSLAPEVNFTEPEITYGYHPPSKKASESEK